MKKILVILFMFLLLCGCSSNAKYHVGVIQLVEHDALDAATNGFKDTLEKEFGSEIKVEVKNAAGESTNCNVIATNFVSNKYDLILANATPALQAAAHATDSIPVLGTSVTEYGVALDTEVVNHVIGGNVSGTSDLAPLDEQAQMIIDLLPSCNSVGIIYCKSEPNSEYQVNEVKTYLKNKGLEVVSMTFSDSNDLQAVCGKLCSGIDALYIPTDNVCASNGTLISTVAEKNNVPIFCGEKSICEKTNGVATLSIDYYNLGVETAKMAISILKGEADISTMEIGYDRAPEKLFNPEMAKKYNIVVPSDFKEIGK